MSANSAGKSGERTRIATKQTPVVYSGGYSKSCSVIQRLKRVKEVFGQMPGIVKCYLFYVLLIDLATISLVYWKKSPDQNVYRFLIIIYVLFQYVSSLHSIYAQNEFTMAGSITLILIESFFVTVDYAEHWTGFDLQYWIVIVQWTAAVGTIAFAYLVYNTMEGFGWRPYRELGARADRLAVHASYRKFTAVLSIDFFFSLMLGLLSVTLVKWPVWLSSLTYFFLITIPVLCTFPLKKSVKNEWLGLMKFVIVLFSLGGIVEGITLIYAILDEMGHVHHVRLHNDKFPASILMIISAALAIVLRVALLYQIYVVVKLAFGSGLLQELSITRKLHRDTYNSTGYGTTLGSTGSIPATRYDYHYRVVQDASGESRDIMNSVSSQPVGLPYRHSVGGSAPEARPLHNAALPRSTDSTTGEATLSSWTPTLGPVTIVTAKSVTLNDS
eukprot:TRINITY_DN5937_c0_g1_i1.p1 TRINITY_DN5937_c0_g1~~TRINITY_DN5937_c0_g1_i1.p1  ORF type:complete len:443 (+),score=19.35 TRINITY_DN5937_c0_g1_i1:40-1368(+)